MTQEQSMQIINEMIALSRGKFQKNSFHFLLWGSVVVVANLGHYTLMEWIHYPYPYAIWLVSIPAFIISFVYGYKQGTSSQAITHIDRSIGGLWLIYSISLILVIAFGAKINYQIPALILALTAIPTMATGLLIRFKPLQFGGISFILFATLTFLTADRANHFLISAAAIFVGYLIPGIMLKRQER